ncbi:DNA mismatch repair protein [Chitinophaga oryzae]|uniref:DNA mismatch repair protein n=1 Tax=Chitinophaga oryzae TaxID=2725414 RepID=A0AAE7D8J0_9BACT|nr:DNA mismatch repair protein [Chitinophaga oryzae]QJB32178.1 DNA mismatch repair protein [Chitinophaga oryzae]QJB38656.1 DNA mismatch repair protein [Chitinophaga oryzae]
MSFIADKQTLDDLSLLGQFNPASVFSLFNQVKTRGAEKLLDEMFLHPLSDADSINNRSAMFRYFGDHPVDFPFNGRQLERMEAYLDEGNEGSYLLALWKIGKKKIAEVLVKDEAYQLEVSGIQSSLRVVSGCIALLRQLEKEGRDQDEPWREWGALVSEVARDPRLKGSPDDQHSMMEHVRFHHLLTGVYRRQLKALLTLIYQLDVYIAVATVAKSRRFSYATALPKEKNIMEAWGVRHPWLEKAVTNTLSFRGDNNVLFLTGANMAGKSTLMKSAGILLYLAHMGFPVAATEMRFSVLDGIYSSVNVPDDLNKGYSHFYAEVLRVKKVAEAVAGGQSLFIIFDELFKGTNVKDAYDATLAVTTAFAGFSNCFFIISTHIFEAGHALMEKESSIRFEFLPTVMKNHVPQYTYRLQRGITEDRQGMIIIENEGILDML